MSTQAHGGIATSLNPDVFITILGIGTILAFLACIVLYRVNKKAEIQLYRLRRRNVLAYRRERQRNAEEIKKLKAKGL